MIVRPDGTRRDSSVTHPDTLKLSIMRQNVRIEDPLQKMRIIQHYITAMEAVVESFHTMVDVLDSQRRTIMTKVTPTFEEISRQDHIKLIVSQARTLATTTIAYIDAHTSKTNVVSLHHHSAKRLLTLALTQLDQVQVMRHARQIKRDVEDVVSHLTLE